MWISKNKLAKKIWDAKVEVINKLDAERLEEEQWERISKLEERVRNLEAKSGISTTGTGTFVETPF